MGLVHLRVPGLMLGRAAAALAGVVSISLVGAGGALANAGSPTAGFGTNGDGYVLQAFGVGSPSISAGQGVAVAPNGDIYQAGFAEGPTSNGEMYLARFTSSGALDRSFGTDGVTYENVGDGASPTTATPIGGLGSLLPSTLVELTPAGNPVVATQASTASGGTQLAVLEFTQGGQLDSAFNSTGYTKIPIGDVTFPAALAIDDAGNIVIAGSAGSSSSTGQFFAARLTSSGALDMGFGKDGIAEPSVGSGDTFGSGVVAQSDGDLTFSVGRESLSSGATSEVIRLTQTGALDDSFGSSGIASFQPSTSASLTESDALGLTQTADGGYAVTGFVEGTIPPVLTISKLTGNGQLDTAFGGSGTGSVLGSNAGLQESVGSQVEVQPDGKLVVTGINLLGSTGAFFVRVNADGSPDESFGAGGQSFGSGPALPILLGTNSAVTPDGNLVTSGVGEAFSSPSPEIASLLQEISLDSAPTVITVADANSVQAGTDVHFVAAAISPDDESLGQVSWDLGGGSFGEATGNTASKTFTTPGTYTVRAEVTDGYGLSTISTQTITVTAAPATTTPSPAPVTPAQVVAPALKLVKLTVSHGKIKATLMCAFAACQVNANLSTHVRKGKGASLSANGHGPAVTVAAAKLTLGINQAHTFTIKLNKAGRKLLARFKRIPATASFKLSNTTPAKAITHRLTIR